MSDMQGLLSGPIKTFHDALEPATAKPAAYLVGENGLAYILPSDEGQAVTITAIHADIDQVQRSDGIYNSSVIFIDLKDNLFDTFVTDPNATPARVTCRFTGPVGTDIPSGTRASNTDASIVVSTQAVAEIPAAGYIDLVCLSEEYLQTIPAEDIDTMVDTITGVTVLNAAAGVTMTRSLVLVYYKDYVIGINKMIARNEVAGVYHYNGEIIQNRNRGYIVLDDSSASQLFLSNSTTKWLTFGNYCGIPFYPSFLTPANQSSAHAIVEITKTEPVSMVAQMTDTVNQQLLKDYCKITLINGTLKQAQDVAMMLYGQAGEAGLFGVLDFPAWSQDQNDVQSGFGVKANKRVMDLKVNYVLESGATSAIKYIIEATASITAV